MDEKLRILLCEDDENLGMLLREYLQAKGYSAELYPDGEAGYKAFLKNKYDLCVFDVMMPKKDGFTLAQDVRAANAEIPIIFLTAKTLKEDILEGFKIGADDYIVKPFSPSEVMARLRAVLRRISRQSVETQSGQILRVSNMEVNLDEYTFCIDGKKIPMTKKEIETMWTLASTPGKVFTRDNLLDSLWGYDYYGDSRTVDSHIKRLRAKLDSVPHPDWTIKTIWGVGYKLEIAGGQ